MSELTALGTVLRNEMGLAGGENTQAEPVEPIAAKKEYELAPPVREQVEMLLEMELLTEEDVARIRAVSREALQLALLESILQRNKRKAEMEEKYGVELTQEEYHALDRALVEMESCKACRDKYCGKKDKYWQTAFEIVAGKLQIKRKRCARWQFQVNEQCARAGVPEIYLGKTLLDYDETAENAEAIAMVRWYVAEYPKDWLYFYGGYGTGKTLLASILTRELICAGHKVIFGDVPTLLSKIKERFDAESRGKSFGDNQTAQMVMNKYKTIPVLVMDDIGAGYMTAWSIGTLYEIINTRYNAGLRTIVTSNIELEDLVKYLSSKGEGWQAQRIVSRLAGNSEKGFFGTRDRRKEIRRYA